MRPRNNIGYYLVKVKAIDARVDCEVELFGKAEFETRERRHFYLKKLLALQIKEFNRD